MPERRMCSSTSSTTSFISTLLVDGSRHSGIWTHRKGSCTTLRWTFPSTGTFPTFPRWLASLERVRSHICPLASPLNGTCPNCVRCRRKAAAKVVVELPAKVSPVEVELPAKVSPVEARETLWTALTPLMTTMDGAKPLSRQSRLPRSESRSSSRTRLKRQTLLPVDGVPFLRTVARKSWMGLPRRLTGARCSVTL